jgi:cytochrome c biogenesis protein CcdA
MLNGIDPILIFHFSKLVTDPKLKANKSKIPITASILSKLPLPAIPIYLSESLTGIYIDTEEKNVDIATDIDTLVIADDPVINQRGIGNTVKITMFASRDSIGLTLLSAMTDLIFPIVTSREYAISYLHGAITVFEGLLHTFSITQDPNTDKYNITLELIKPAKPSKILSTEVPAIKGIQFDPSKVPA